MDDKLNEVLASADINTAQRLSMFLANAAQETELLAALAEKYNPPEYQYFENKYGYLSQKGIELGNKGPGDGSKYRGRGLLHITGRYNYEIATFGYATDKPYLKYASYNDWQGTSQTQTLPSVQNADGTVTVMGTIPAGWSVRVLFPAQSATVKAKYADYFDAAESGTFSITSPDKRSAGQVTVLAVKTNFVEDAAQISDNGNKVLAAQIGCMVLAL